MELSWNQVICDACWWAQHGERNPVRVRNRGELICAFCGQVTDGGIFVRRNPATVPFPREER